jgi:hypothetical protein
VVKWHLYLLLEGTNWDKVLYVLAKREPEAVDCPKSEPPLKALPVVGVVDPKTLVSDAPAARVAPLAFPLPPNVEVPPPNGLGPALAGLGGAKEKVPLVEVAVF